jgi:GntR family carbon starvation induced transcriptional regulator
MRGNSRTAKAYHAIRQDILDGKHEPRGRLRIDLLSNAFGVSVGVIREALARLTADRLVVAEPQRGFTVAPISAVDLTDLTAVRIELETRCLRQSILRGDLAWEGRVISSLHQLNHTPRHAGAGAVNLEFANAHKEFHDALVSAGDSVWYLRLRDQLFTQAERYRRFTLPYVRVERDVSQEHQAIADAALARDVEGAVRAMAAHLELTAGILLGSDAPFDEVFSSSIADADRDSRCADSKDGAQPKELFANSIQGQ